MADSSEPVGVNGVDVDVSSPSHRGEVLSLSSTDAPDFLTIDENIRLLWKDIKYSVPVPKTKSTAAYDKEILHGLTGSVCSGEMVGILGPTGAGKTSLLDIISARRPFTSGSLTLNGIPVTKKYLLQHSGFVLQHDILTAPLTVEETLMFYAHVRSPRSSTLAEKKALVDRIIAQLSLEKARKTKVGNPMIKGLSGGEKRRLSIAIELVAEPKILFLDEPTTGLDASTAKKIVKILRALSLKGMAIACTIHQPRGSIFMSFDKILLLSCGYTVYLGPPDNVMDHFRALGHQPEPLTNVADFIIDVVTLRRQAVELSQTGEDEKVELAQKLSNSFEESREGEHVRQECARLDNSPTKLLEPRLKKRDRITWFSETRHLYVRSIKNIFRDPSILRARIFQTATSSILLALVFMQLGIDAYGAQSRAGVLTFITINACFVVATSILNVFPVQRLVFERDRVFRLYSVSAYYVSIVLTELPFIFIFPILSSVIYYWSVDLRGGASHYFTFLGILMLIYEAATGIGMAISALVKNLQMAATFGPVVIVISATFGGFFANESVIPVFLRWINYVSFIRWGLQSLFQNEFRNRNLVCTQSDIDQGICRFSNGDQLLSLFQYDDSRSWLAPMILLIETGVFFVLGYLFLKWKDRKVSR